MVGLVGEQAGVLERVSQHELDKADEMIRLVKDKFRDDRHKLGVELYAAVVGSLGVQTVEKFLGGFFAALERTYASVPPGRQPVLLVPLEVPSVCQLSSTLQIRTMVSGSSTYGSGK